MNSELNLRVAIVGSGISGLVAAHLLQRDHEIAVFEANDYVGGHTHTVDVDLGAGSFSVDTGFIVYNEQNYPNFTRLLTQLGVPTQSSTMSFSVRMRDPELEYNGSTFRQLFAQRRNLMRPRFYRMLTDIVRFNRSAPLAIQNGAEDLTLGEYVESAGYSPEFIHRYLVPMGAAIWSSPNAQVLEMPALFFVRFFENHGMLSVNDRPEWRTVTGGAAQYVERLTTTFTDRIRLRTPVSEVRRGNGEVWVDGERFDHVIMACHADQALQVLADPSEEERNILGAIPYQANRVVLHTDRSILPRRRAAWGAWNYHVSDRDDAAVGVTYNMNMLQSLSTPEPLCITLNDVEDIDPRHVIDTFTYFHPMFSRQGIRAQRRHAEISGVRRTHYVGAYWGNGFHEDGVVSAQVACERLGAAS